MRFTLPTTLPGFIPAHNPPPPLAVYGIDQLQTLKRFNRGDFLTYTGQQAPPHRSADEAAALAGKLGISEDEAELFTRIKRWADLTVASLPPRDPYEIRYVTAVSGQALWKTMTITNELACSINLPGKFDYPKWVPAPSTVRVNGPGGPSSGFIAEVYLATKEQADALAGELGGTVKEQQLPGVFFYDYPESEPRRVFQIVVGGKTIYAGEALARKYKAGVGAPGVWDGFEWVSNIDPDVGEHDLRPEIPIPCRDLFPTEQFQTSSFGGLLQIVNLTLREETEIEIVRRIDRNVREIKAGLVGG